VSADTGHPGWEHVTDTDSSIGGTVSSRNTRRTAERCGRCGRAFKSDEPIWRVLAWRTVSPFVVRRQLSVWCGRCTPERCQRERCVLPCQQCGRPTGVIPGRRPFCSDRCTWSWYNAQRNSRRAAERLPKPCSGCGKPFVRTRSDATTCSAACRQRIHRLHSSTQRR
jgi:hypothetical protein